jgi:hypothetical protein
MLDDPAYGEHRAHYWLDVARYADTHGFEFDNFRSIWPYRDYVVRAFNQNMPFDRFTIEQLAGDLLPQATIDQRVATGFLRNSMSTGEGGAIEDEFAAIAAKDRVEAVAAAWLGLTMGCASCHDHKFDPITQKDFYRMAAFFRNTTQAVFDDNVAAPPPVVLVGDEQTPSLVVEERNTPAVANVLTRGRYDQPGERVTAGVPQEHRQDVPVQGGEPVVEGQRRRAAGQPTARVHPEQRLLHGQDPPVAAQPGRLLRERVRLDGERRAPIRLDRVVAQDRHLAPPRWTRLVRVRRSSS